MFEEIVSFIRRMQHKPKGFIPLHEPHFVGNEKEYVLDAIDSGFVSSVGEYVNLFEQRLCQVTGASHAVATVNGTSALHAALVVAGVENNDEVISQPLTFVATANAISYCGAKPVFIDVDRDTLGLSPAKLADFLKKNSKFGPDGMSYNKITGRRIKACVPVHIFGFPARIQEIKEICTITSVQNDCKKEPV